MSKANILESLKDEWERFLRTAENIPSNNLGLPGAVGRWSVAQCLIHIAGWDEVVLNVVETYIQSGNKRNFGSPHDMNERYLEDKKDMDLETSWAHLRDTHVALIACLQSLPDEIFVSDSYLGNCIGQALAHYKEHREDIENFGKDLSSGTKRH